MGRGAANDKTVVAAPARKKTLGEIKREKAEIARVERQEEIREQIADGSLIVRQATDAERAAWA